MMHPSLFPQLCLSQVPVLGMCSDCCGVSIQWISVALSQQGHCEEYRSNWTALGWMVFGEWGFFHLSENLLGLSMQSFLNLHNNGVTTYWRI